MKRWYVIHTHVQGETKALHHLQRQGFDAYLPCYSKRRRHARKTDWVKAPLFPRYLFVHLDLAADRWRPVLSTVGVAQMVMNGERPAELPETVVADIRAREGEDGLVELNDALRFKRGDKVEVLDGAFSEYEGIFEAMDDRERVFILLDLFGRKTRVRLPVEAVKVCA